MDIGRIWTRKKPRLFTFIDICSNLSKEEAKAFVDICWNFSVVDRPIHLNICGYLRKSEHGRSQFLCECTFEGS